jgi:hypothetical protein
MSIAFLLEPGPLVNALDSNQYMVTGTDSFDITIPRASLKKPVSGHHVRRGG